MKTLFQTFVHLTCFCVLTQAGQVTLTVNDSTSIGATILADEISIGTNEVAEVTSVYGNGSGATLQVIKNSITNSITMGTVTPDYWRPRTVAGPATIRQVRIGSNSSCWFCTLKIEPESFPPDKTIIIPQGTPGANIIMEQSSDLVHWTNSTPGLYTNTAINSLFFRLRAERL